jgi:hypothetical protein
MQELKYPDEGALRLRKGHKLHPWASTSAKRVSVALARGRHP